MGSATSSQQYLDEYFSLEDLSPVFVADINLEVPTPPGRGFVFEVGGRFVWAHVSLSPEGRPLVRWSASVSPEEQELLRPMLRENILANPLH